MNGSLTLKVANQSSTPISVTQEGMAAADYLDI